MDPYEVLGVSRDADDETIKKAYRALVKKYHPDRYVNTPMAETASEKMKQINEAYDMITNKNTNYGNPYGSNPYGGSTYGGNPFGGYGSAYNDNYDYSRISFDTVRRLITMRRYAEAEAMLEKLNKDAEWYYLMGLVYVNKGWYQQGMEYIRKAAQLDPSNPEYAAAANGFENNNRNYKNVVYTSGTPFCGLCTSLCLSWLCCNNGCFCCC